MRTVLLALAALATCVQDPEAGPAATAAAPDTAEWFLSEYGFRIPPKNTAEFLNCAEWWHPLEHLVEFCLPLSAVPPEGLTLCKDPRHQAPAGRHPRPIPPWVYEDDPEGRRPISRSGWGYNCPDAPEGTPVRVVTAADLEWIRSTLNRKLQRAGAVRDPEHPEGGLDLGGESSVFAR